MAEPLRYDAGWRYDDPRLRWDGLAPENTPTPMASDYNMISAEISEANITLIRQKFDEIRALLPDLPEMTAATRKRLLGVDLSSELDEIAREAMDAHPEWKPVVVDLTEYAKDREFAEDTAPIESDADELHDFIRLMRRLARNDERRDTLAIYHQLAELTTRGNAEAKTYFDRMAVFFPGRPKNPVTPPPTP